MFWRICYFPCFGSFFPSRKKGPWKHDSLIQTVFVLVPSHLFKRPILFGTNECIETSALSKKPPLFYKATVLTTIWYHMLYCFYPCDALLILIRSNNKALNIYSKCVITFEHSVLHWGRSSMFINTLLCKGHSFGSSCRHPCFATDFA